MEFDLNLDQSYVDRHWKHVDQKFFHFLKEASRLETWPLLNNSQFQKKLKEFAEKTKHFPTKEWSENHKEITKLMSYLTLQQFIFLLHWLDFHYPGLSFHFVMEAKQTKNCIYSSVFMKRLKKIKEAGYLNNIFTPMRTRLINGLLESDDDDDDEDEDESIMAPNIL